MRFRKYIYLFIVASLIASCSTSVKLPIKEPKQSIALDVITLSSDYMEGRAVGSEGERKAAEYIVTRFKELGIAPAGENGTYFQTFTRRNNKNPHGEDNGTGEVITARNVLGMIDNHAEKTVIIGAHYDHLGYGDENSLYSGPAAIHNGADDNASGVSGVLYLAESLKKSNLKGHNYLFICFTGEEKGLWGSNYYVNHPDLDKSKISYMINMDMIGRLNDEKKLSISGIGTSPSFEPLIDKIKTNLHIVKDYSGLGPSDYASFYSADIPVLGFFTGQHKDYHKPSDVHEFINYTGLQEVVEYIYTITSKLDKIKKLEFTRTKDESQEQMSFNVTLGIMPDYLYDEEGLKIDGTKEDRPGAKAGLQKGDIIIKMGEYDVPDMQAYMKCLSIFNPGQTVEVIYIRNGIKSSVNVTF